MGSVPPPALGLRASSGEAHPSQLSEAHGQAGSAAPNRDIFEGPSPASPACRPGAQGQLTALLSQPGLPCRTEGWWGCRPPPAVGLSEVNAPTHTEPFTHLCPHCDAGPPLQLGVKWWEQSRGQGPRAQGAARAGNGLASQEAPGVGEHQAPLPLCGSLRSWPRRTLPLPSSHPCPEEQSPSAPGSARGGSQPSLSQDEGPRCLGGIQAAYPWARAPFPPHPALALASQASLPGAIFRGLGPKSTTSRPPGPPPLGGCGGKAHSARSEGRHRPQPLACVRVQPQPDGWAEARGQDAGGPTAAGGHPQQVLPAAGSLLGSATGPGTPARLCRKQPVPKRSARQAGGCPNKLPRAQGLCCRPALQAPAASTTRQAGRRGPGQAWETGSEQGRAGSPRPLSTHPAKVGASDPGTAGARAEPGAGVHSLCALTRECPGA